VNWLDSRILRFAAESRAAEIDPLAYNRP